jgi:hypothetical protein
MSNNNLSNKITICCAIFLWALGAQASTLPPDPNNAALLYYQALSLWSDVRSSYADTDAAQEPNDDSETPPSKDKTKLDELLAFQYKMEREYERKFGKKERESRRRLMRNRTIQIVEAASRIPHCTWGIYYSKGWELIALLPLRQLAFLLDDDARALADAGDYRPALERCLTIRRFARHLGDEGMNMHNMSLGADGVAFNRIRYILRSMPPDAGILEWLKAQLADTPGASESFVPALKFDYELALQRLHASPKTVAWIRSRLLVEAAFAAKNKEAEEKLRSMKDEELIPLIQEDASMLFDPFFDSIRRAIENDKPYAQTYAELKLLIYKLKGNVSFYIIAPFYDLTCIEVTPRFYDLHINLRTAINSVEAAIEIYLIKAKTGQLPQKLPDGLPKDPFTGRDFGYEITDECFALRCQGEEFQRGRLRQKLEFKVTSGDDSNK